MKIQSSPIRVEVVGLANGKWKMEPARIQTESASSVVHPRSKDVTFFIAYDRVEIPQTILARTQRDAYRENDFVYFRPDLELSDRGRQAQDDEDDDAEPVFKAEDYLDAFLAIRTPIDALAFLDKYGDPERQPVTELSRIRELQAFLKEVSKLPLHQWSEK